MSRITRAVIKRAPDALGIPESDIKSVDIVKGVVVLWNRRKIAYPSDWTFLS